MVVIAVIIFFGARGRENSNIFPHTTCVLRGFFPHDFRKYNAKAYHSFFSFWCLLVADFNAAQIKPQETSAPFLRKGLNLKRDYPFKAARELVLLSFGEELRESEAVFALGGCRQLWCWPPRDTHQLLVQCFEGRSKTM